jgi:hypothetical protein
MKLLQAEKKSTPTALMAVLIIVLSTSGPAFGQDARISKGTKATPKIGTAFSKAAIKALLTIERTNNRDLVDAAMIELSGAETNPTEHSVVYDIQLFEAIYARNESARQSLLEAERAEAEAYSNQGPAYMGSSKVHDEDHVCIAAWLPRLRALNAQTPKRCFHVEP